MSQYVTRDELKVALNEQTDEIIGIVKDLMSQTSNQFAGVNERLDRLDAKYDHLINTIDGFLARIDRYEVELAARDSQFERLLVWARKVSEKTGIPLENL